MRISDWSSDVCSSDQKRRNAAQQQGRIGARQREQGKARRRGPLGGQAGGSGYGDEHRAAGARRLFDQFIAASRRQQDETAGRVDAGAGEGADQLVERIVAPDILARAKDGAGRRAEGGGMDRSEETTSEIQSLMRNSYAVFCLKKK